MKLTTQWLEYFALQIKPEVYLEIGVNQAQTFNRLPAGYAVGVDPNPDCKKFIKRGRSKFYCMTSDYFFDTKDALELRGKVNMIFIDGLHQCDQVMIDFHNSLLMLGKTGWIFLHDTWPPDSRHTYPDRCGDVYKALNSLHSFVKQNDDYEIITLPWAFGLTVIRKGPPTNEDIMGQG